MMHKRFHRRNETSEQELQLPQPADFEWMQSAPLLNLLNLPLQYIPARLQRLSRGEASTNAVGRLDDGDGSRRSSETNIITQLDGQLATVTHALSTKQLQQKIGNILRAARDDETRLQSDLIDLLGFECIDLVAFILQNCTQLLNALSKTTAGDQRLDDTSLATEAEASVASTDGIDGSLDRLVSGGDSLINNGEESLLAAAERLQSNRPQPSTLPTYRPGPQFTITSESEKKQAKQMRKLERRQYQQQQREDGEWEQLPPELMAANVNNAGDGQQQQQLGSLNQPKYPHVYGNQATLQRTSNVSVYGSTFTLPAGAERRDTTEYEEISIPLSRSAPPGVGERLIAVSELEKWMQPVYRGYTSLNRVQSLVYPIAYRTNENMLICAPTGAGKTDVAMLSVLACLRQYRDEETGELAKNDFKLVYVAPMKALAAEIVRKFSGRLAPLGITVKELTGDMQLTKSEIMETQMIVTTPEKWDVVTRKATTDVDLAQKVRLLILDEVHLLHDDRGAVLEALVARTLRQVESSQSMIRIVGLSATLPNFIDVAAFLRVNPYRGLFFFDDGFRPVPLGQTFIGVKGGDMRSATVRERMNQAMFDKILEILPQQRQVMVFVHARKDTVRTGYTISQMARESGNTALFEPSENDGEDHRVQSMTEELDKSRNRELRELGRYGIGIHHAGMLRSDRTLVERMFSAGLLKVLVCTATLAWGVNLPAYAVIIKGTNVYDSEKGAFVDLSILDVMQIFGRAGRPQFEPHGLGFILTTHDKLAHYLRHMASRQPIESRFADYLFDNLNAEISATGTVSNIDEAVQWLGYTYLFIRMQRNPHVYGLQSWNRSLDPNLVQHRRELCISAARKLAENQMIAFDENTGYLTPKDTGRIAASFYLRLDSVEVFNKALHPRCSEADVLGVVACSHEFDGVKVRDEELRELDKLVSKGACPCAIKQKSDQTVSKVNILLQAYISRANLEDFALISDTNYISQNAPRILRSLFEMTLKRNWGPTASRVLTLCKSIERRMWGFEHPLGQFGIAPNPLKAGKSHSYSPTLTLEIIRKLDSAPRETASIDLLRDMSVEELGDLVRNRRAGPILQKCVWWFPMVDVETRVTPITRSVMRVEVAITPSFEWCDRYHGTVEPWWIWVEDGVSTEILASEYWLLQKRQHSETSRLNFVIPVSDPLPTQLFLRIVSDRWIAAENIVPISFRQVVLPDSASPHTDLLPLRPLPVSAVDDDLVEEYFRAKFAYFNPIQTQVFHSLYHQQHNVLLGAPTSSGKTVCAELAIFGAFRRQPNCKCVYIAPLKALVRERMSDWKQGLERLLGRRIVELTGESVPDLKAILEADIIVTTPEKWDGVSRHWKQRRYVQSVSLVVIDEIHLLGGDRGPTLEVIVSRLNFIGFHTGNKVRVVGLSTALANARDLANWLNVHPTAGFFNFRHSVRPVPLEIYIDGFPGRHYCPRMATMNKPVFQSIRTHSLGKPVIVFVSSRRQTRLTATDLMALCVNYSPTNPKIFLRMPEEDMDVICNSQIKDGNLKLSLAFGIGIHHAGLMESDRRVVEELFVNQKIQVLIATSTVAWGVNYPAHLVIVKGTEFFDAKQKKYVDFPITDVLQMMGRAGRPQYDTSGKAHIMVHDVKKSFYKKFLHEPFPVESSLHLDRHLHDHLNAEIVAGTVRDRQQAIEYLTWTYFYRRLRMNPSYYGLVPQVLCGEDERNSIENKNESLGHSVVTSEDIDFFLTDLIDEAMAELDYSRCIVIDDEQPDLLTSTVFGEIASFYYLHHKTVRMFYQVISADSSLEQLLQALADSCEYDELPVRHNEDQLNMVFADQLPLEVQVRDWMSPHVKTFLLLQAHLSRYTVDRLPIADYATDTKTVLDQAIRIIQSLIDFSASSLNRVALVQRCITLLQCIKSAIWWSEEYQTQQQKQELAKNGKPIRSPSIARCSLRLLDSKSDGSLKEKTTDAGAEWVFVKPQQSGWKVRMDLQLQFKSSHDGLANLPYLQKSHPEGWIVLISELKTGRLLCLKRLTADMANSRNPGAHCNLETSMELELDEIVADPTDGLMIEISVHSDCYFNAEPACRRLTIY